MDIDGLGYNSTFWICPVRLNFFMNIINIYKLGLYC
jgi:hypothetical protein